MPLRKVALLLVIVVLAGITVQAARLIALGGIFPINQTQADTEPEIRSVSLPEIALQGGYAKLLILYSDQDEGTRQVRDHVAAVARMARLNARLVNIASLYAHSALAELGANDLLVIATDQVHRLRSYRSVVDYVAQGGKAVFLKRSHFTPFDALVGIAVNRGHSASLSNGIDLVQPMFPGLDDIALETGAHATLDVDLAPQARLLAVSREGGPMIWTHTYGSGEVLYVNSTLLQLKQMRGLLLQCIAYLPDYFLSTKFNALVFNIDDFPAPFVLGQHPKIYPYYGMTTPTFFRQVWWPDTYNFIRRFNVRLTGMAMLTFNDDTSTPLEGASAIDIRQMTYFGRRLSEVGGELGLHGYNHQSLALAGQMNFDQYGYKPWESQVTMEEGLRILRETLGGMFGDVGLYSYVPPSNIVSREGRLAIRNVFSDIRVFAGLYTGLLEPGLLLQEFGRDPYVPEVLSFPRLSSGYLHSETLMWDIINGIAHFGLVHHFVHPDDLLDPARSGGYIWEEMNRQIAMKFSAIRRHFPFLRPKTLIEAYTYFVQTEPLQVFTASRGDVIEVSYNMEDTEVYHFLRLRNRRVVRVDGGEFQLICRDNNLYLIERRSGHLSIIVARR